jgi:hypothetical protein
MFDHFAIGIADWNKGRVEAELKRRNLHYTPVDYAALLPFTGHR